MMRRSVLIVDDDPAIRTFVALTLEIEGYSTRTAANAQEALEEVERQRPDLVVLDMMMPGMDGRAFAHVVCEQGLPPHLVLMSSRPEVRRWAKELGAAGYVSKPFDLDELLAQVHRLCGTAS
jgi:two-component system, OmpR family, response regulator MprA